MAMRPEPVLPGSRRYWPAPASSSRIPGLDGIRAIAILCVVIAHSIDPQQSSIVNLDQLGLMGVTIFFVLSGFLITTLLLDEEQAHGRISIRLFYLRRAFRIFPAAYFFICSMWVLSLIGVMPLSGRDLAHAASYTMNYYSWEERSWQVGHLWSLAVEEQFYLLWPLALVTLRHRGRLILLSVIVVLCPLLRYVYDAALPGLRFLITESFETSADPLAFGCLLAFLRPHLQEISVYRRLISRWWTPMLLALAALTMSQSARLIGILGPLEHTALYFTLALALDSVISQSKSTIVGLVLNSRVAVFIGGISYSLYLWQQPFLNPHSSAWWNDPPVGVALAVGAAIASYYCLEKPLLGVRRRLENRGDHGNVAVASRAAAQ